MFRRRLWLLPALLAGTLAACGAPPAVRPIASGSRVAPGKGNGRAGTAAAAPMPMVDRSRLNTYFTELAHLSPRPPGSPMLERCRQYLIDRLRAFPLQVREEPFTAETPAGSIAMSSIIAEKRGNNDRIVYLATHIDTKAMARVPFLGANDSGSSTAAVLELARLIAGADTRLTWRFAFFDGEEAIQGSISDGDGLYGSRRHADGLNRSGEALKVRAVILLDMIGDADLNLVQDSNSAEELYALLARCCERLGYSRILTGGETTMIDDHVPFGELGIPVLDVIDFSYGPGNGYWHTGRDTPEHVSLDSIFMVADAVRCMVADLDAEAAPVPAKAR